MKYLKTKLEQWLDGSKISEMVYHGTNKNFNKFSSKYSSMGGIIWFTNDLKSIENGEVGASGKGYIKCLYVKMLNPAGWKEYEKYTLGQLKDLGYDGCILPDNDRFDGFVFNPNQIKIVKTI